MIDIESRFTYPGGRTKLILTMWGDKVSANKTNVVLSLSRPKTRNRFIVVQLKYLRGYLRTVGIFEDIYRKYSLLTERTIRDYARDIASKLLQMGLITRKEEINEIK